MAIPTETRALATTQGGTSLDRRRWFCYLPTTQPPRSFIAPRHYFCRTVIDEVLSHLLFSPPTSDAVNAAAAAAAKAKATVERERQRRLPRSIHALFLFPFGSSVPPLLAPSGVPPALPPGFYASGGPGGRDGTKGRREGGRLLRPLRLATSGNSATKPCTADDALARLARRSLVGSSVGGFGRRRLHMIS